MSTATPDRPVLAIWAERPGPGSLPAVADEFGAEFAAQLAEASLFDRIEPWADGRFWGVDGRRVIVFEPEDAGEWFDRRVSEDFALQPADGADRSAAVVSFFTGEFEEGASKVVLMVGEAPNLDPNFVIGAFVCLNDHDVVIGPRADGGIYLIGAGAPLPPLFDGLDWDGPDFLTHVCARLAETGRTLSLLPPWPGLRTAGDCRALAGRLLALRLAGAKTSAERTGKLLLHGH